MRKLRLAVLAMVLTVVPAMGALAQSEEGQVIVVHGVPDLLVDVYVNGELTLEDFAYGDVAGPLALPAGSYDLEVYAADADPEADEPALSGSTDLPAGAVATISANLDADGAPTLGVYVENSDSIAAGEARVTARHLAQFGAVDVLANDGAVFEGVENGQGGDVDVPADTYNIKITAAGDPETVAFDADVALAEGTNTIAYAIGSVEGGSFQVVTASVSGLGESPAGVPTGTAGLVGSTSPVIWAILAVLSVAALGGSVAVARNRR
ncbi:MAG: DUF4397 domain-containing protein [Acidimicrobiia bacterium]|jgi:hypothetical protein